MAEIITMPKLGLGMSFGTITTVSVKEGDSVREGDVLLEFETNKLAEEITSPIDGYVLRVLVEEDDEVEICKPLVVVGEPGEAFTLEEDEKDGGEEAEIQQSVLVREPPEKIPQASPIAKKAAKEMGVDLNQVSGTGPEGRIMREDVLRFAKEEKGKAADEETELSAARKTIAAHMEQSKREAPHAYLKAVVDVTSLMKWKQTLTKKLEQKVTWNDLIVKAAALALEKVPEVNVSLRGGKLISHNHINIGIAVNNEKGLLVPVVHDANKKSLEELAKTTSDLIRRTKEGGLKPHNLEGGTFTVTNLGGFGIREFYAVINVPEAAILAVGEVYDAPVACSGGIFAAKKLTLCLSVDHRVIDGIVAANYLNMLKELLETPYGFLL